MNINKLPQLKRFETYLVEGMPVCWTHSISKPVSSTTIQTGILVYEGSLLNPCWKINMDGDISIYLLVFLEKKHENSQWISY